MRRCLLLLLLVLAALGCATEGPDRLQLARSHHELGDQLLRESDFVGAMRELLLAAEMDPRNPNIHMSLAVAYRNRGLPEDAEKNLRRAISLDDENPEFHQALGALLLDLHRYAEAVPELEAAAKDLRYRTPHYAFTNLGYAYLGQGDAPRAIDNFRQALVTAPNYVFAHRGMGDAYYLLGRYGEAAESYRAGLSYYSSDGDSYLGLGLSEAKQGRLEQALKALRSALDVAPGSDAARRARVYLDRLERGQALDQEVPGPGSGRPEHW